MPNLSLIVLTIGARPLVVHEAHETTAMDSGSYSSTLTPTTMVGVSASFAGAEMMTCERIQAKAPSVVELGGGRSSSILGALHKGALH